jgi:diguanylate cyclase (GGDEF)-like protein
MGNNHKRTPTGREWQDVKAEICQAETREEFEAIIRQIWAHDALTGLLNHRGFEDRLQCVRSSLESSAPISEDALEYSLRRRTDEMRRHYFASIACIDMDYFKRINTAIGYERADVVLQTFAEYLHSEFRVSDIIGRIHGDEFAVAVPMVPKEGVEVFLKKVQARLHEHKWPWPLEDAEDHHFSVTFTANIVVIRDPKEFDNIIEIFRKALDEVSEKKREERNTGQCLRNE